MNHHLDSRQPMGAAPCLQTSFALNQIGEVSCVCVRRRLWVVGTKRNETAESDQREEKTEQLE